MMQANFDREDLQQAVDALRKGGLILYPTDTVWGIGCDATRSDAVRRVFQLKRRSDAKALIILLPDADHLYRYVEEIPDAAEQLIAAAVAPLTIVYDRGRSVAPELLGPDGSIGIRITADPFCRALCNALRRPIVSTSANVSGQLAPAIFSQIAPEIIEGVDYVVRFRRDDARCASPSNVIKVSNNGTFKILR